MKEIVFDGVSLLCDIDNAPNVSVIYFVCDKSDLDTYLYIGKTKNLRIRWSNHHKIHDVLNTCETPVIKWILTKESDLDEFEKTFIREFSPSLNGKMYADIQERHTVQLDEGDWQWLVDERARSGKPHKTIINILITNEQTRRTAKNTPISQENTSQTPPVSIPGM